MRSFQIVLDCFRLFQNVWLTVWLHMGVLLLLLTIWLVQNQANRPVNLHPLFLKIGHPAFWKSGTLLFAKSRLKKTGSFFIQKEKRPGCLFSFWITMTLVFCTLFFSKSRVPNFQKAGCPIFKNSGCRLTGQKIFWYFYPSTISRVFSWWICIKL